MTTYTVSVKDINGKFVRYEVPEDVYIYIRQLETAIQTLEDEWNSLKPLLGNLKDKSPRFEVLP
jgi:hypothetical protein